VTVCGGTYLGEGFVEVESVSAQGEIELQPVGAQPANRPGGYHEPHDRNGAGHAGRYKRRADERNPIH
jgi:hypothetical protein